MDTQIIEAGSTALTINNNTKNWEDALEYFLACQDVKESSKILYRRTLSIFYSWIQETNRKLDSLTRADIVEYKNDLLSKGLSSLSVSSYLTSLRKFYIWAESERLYPNICKGIKTPKRIQAFKKQHLTEDKSKELLAYFNALSLRDYAIVNLILRTGLRTIEVVRANIEDITFKGDRRILKVWGKGRDEKDDFVILTDKAYKPIEDYLATRKGARINEPLFISESNRNEGGRLTTRTISGMCKSGLIHIGLNSHEFTAHSLRHTTAVEILKHGGNITDAQAVLRHSNPATTQIYTESIKTELRIKNAPEALIDTAF